ncbi:DeoR/GlpR family DNA-binding transcription regulator [Staphylococcus coagulans]|uniref:DeoR/GlpR family DNA-binding transcription regulator n=1 Tax=Staphylococcus coagulans TaxID=74706 RepID=A0ABU1EWV8_9STAP|nr:DeoR/GlpR family DNA-binding transcription regulator [Staphylococcus coagulans]MDR5602600.1 DeoR/GlpR family DNA-binding transcription regulator [Staphylococcus coagulans]MDR9833090.1 DeoR/GlpR family DNA-binding transcription regulator [Staphylococcus coagulans]
MYKKKSRLEMICNRIATNGKVFVSDLALYFEVTPETIRKDLEQLEEDKKVTRIHGGAVKYNYLNKEQSFVNKWQKQAAVKERLAMQAAQFIRNGEIIVLDGGTTTGRIPKYLNHLSNCTFVTPSLITVTELNKAVEEQRIDAEIIMLPGKTNTAQDVVRGSLTNQLLQQFKFHKAFLSCGAFDTTSIYEYDLEEALVSNTMIQQSVETFLVTDSTKRDNQAAFVINAFKAIDYMITDYAKPDKIVFDEHHWLQV